MKTSTLKSLFANNSIKVYDASESKSKWTRVPGTTVKFTKEVLDNILVCKLLECKSDYSDEPILKLLVETFDEKVWIPVDLSVIKLRKLEHNMEVNPKSVFVYDITDEEHTKTVCVCKPI